MAGGNFFLESEPDADLALRQQLYILVSGMEGRATVSLKVFPIFHSRLRPFVQQLRKREHWQQCRASFFSWFVVPKCSSHLCQVKIIPEPTNATRRISHLNSKISANAVTYGGSAIPEEDTLAARDSMSPKARWVS